MKIGFYIIVQYFLKTIYTCANVIYCFIFSIVQSSSSWDSWFGSVSDFKTLT